MMKKVLYGILIFGFLAIIGCAVFVENFNIFDDPIEKELKVECDYKGLRKAKMIEVGGNAATNNSIQIYVSKYNNEEINESETIFVASSGFIKPKDVSFEWKNLDTLTIKYNKRLDVFKQKKETESINPKVILEYKQM